MKKKENTNTSKNLNEQSITPKQGKPLQQIIPNNFPHTRQMNLVFNYQNFKVKKGRDYIPPYEPFEIFPLWPEEEEVEVTQNNKLITNKK